MKKLLTLALILATFAGFSQSKSVPLIPFGTSDTILVMEADIYKIDNEVGDSTATVEYFYRGQMQKMIADTNQTEFATRTNRLIAPSGVGFMINVDRIQGISRLTDSTCTMFYLKGNTRIRLNLTVPASSINNTINAL